MCTDKGTMTDPRHSVCGGSLEGGGQVNGSGQGSAFFLFYKFLLVVCFNVFFKSYPVVHGSILLITSCGNMQQCPRTERIGVAFPPKGNFPPEATQGFLFLGTQVFLPAPSGAASMSGTLLCPAATAVRMVRSLESCSVQSSKYISACGFLPFYTKPIDSSILGYSASHSIAMSHLNSPLYGI